MKYLDMDVGCPVRFKCGKEIGAAAVSGGLGLLGTIGSSASAASSSRQALLANIQENNKNREFNAAEAQKQRDWQSDEWLRQQNFLNQYNAPTAQVQRAQQAGFNPASVLAGNGQGAGLSAAPATTAPSGGHASVTTPNPAEATSQASAFGSIISGVSEFLGTLNKANVDSAQANTLRETLYAKVQNLLADTDYKNLMSQYQDLQNTFFKENKGKYAEKLDKEIRKIHADTMLAESERDYKRILQSLVAAQEILVKHQADFQERSVQVMDIFLKQAERYIKSKIGLNEASARQASTGAVANLAIANNQNEQAETTKQMRPYSVEVEKFRSELLQAEGVNQKFWNSVNSQTRHAHVEKVLVDLREAQSRVQLNAKQQEYLKALAAKIEKETDWIAFNNLVGAYTDVLNAGANQMNAIGNLLPWNALKGSPGAIQPRTSPSVPYN